MYILLLIIAVAFCIACGLFDQLETVKGIAKGVAVEGDTWLVGTKPSFLALFARDTLVLVFCTAPSVIGQLIHNPGIAYGLLIMPVIYGIKHILGGLSWIGAITPPNPNENYSAWQKFLQWW